jgi:membrane-bound metal-dependent hydrolase YbcI (DUF457 family)
MLIYDPPSFAVRSMPLLDPLSDNDVHTKAKATRFDMGILSSYQMHVTLTNVFVLNIWIYAGKRLSKRLWRC